MSDKNKIIRFIDSEYRELFNIPDGGNIKVTYPIGDGRGIQVRACEFLDETHAKIGGNVYHICEFAERMEALGAKYEPEAQLYGAEILPFTAGEEKYFTYNREEGNTCIGHISGEFGREGDRFFSSWSDRDNGRNTSEFQAELHCAVYALRKNLLKDYDTMLAYCQSHPEAMLDGGDTYKRYGFKLETDTRQYFTNCFFGDNMRDARFIVYAYDKTAPVIEQARLWDVLPRTADESKMFYRNDAEADRCVGYVRGDFGKRGDEFWHNWFEGGSERNTPEFKSELQVIVNGLRKDVLKDLKSTQDYCYKHPEARLPGDIHRYGFKVETQSRQYFIRCTVLRDDYFYVFAYDKTAAREQEKPSVLKQIRDAQKTPKSLRKEKAPDKQKGGAEL